MKPNFKVDYSNTNAAIQRYAQVVEKSCAELALQNARLIAVAMATATEPFGSTGADKEPGQNAIKGDLFGSRRGSTRYKGIGVFRRIGGSQSAPVGANQHNKKGNGSNVLLVTKEVNLGWEKSNVIHIAKEMWNPRANNTVMRAFHQKARSKKTGRVANISQSTIGRWKVMDQMWVSDSSADRYMRSVHKLVGFAKSGWAACARQLGGTRGIPGWVTRNKAPGEIQDHSKQRNPYVMLHNKVDYLRRALSTSRFNNALEVQREKFLKHVERVLRAEARNAIRN